MERMSNQSEREQLQSYANDIHKKVKFLFQRRNINIAGYEPKIELNDTEIKFVASAFAENFIDAPDMIEITIIDNNDPTGDRGVMVATEHADHDSVYSSSYLICAHSERTGVFVAKDVSRSPTDYHAVERGDAKIEKIYDDAPVDESERAALLAMIAKL